MVVTSVVSEMIVPGGGDCETLATPLQSAKVCWLERSGRTAPQFRSAYNALGHDHEQVSVGGVESTTVSLKLHELVFSDASYAL